MHCVCGPIRRFQARWCSEAIRLYNGLLLVWLPSQICATVLLLKMSEFSTLQYCGHIGVLLQNEQSLIRHSEKKNVSLPGSLFSIDCKIWESVIFSPSRTSANRSVLAVHKTTTHSESFVHFN